MRKRCWVNTCGPEAIGLRMAATDEVGAEYIKNQTPPEPDDDFNVT